MTATICLADDLTKTNTEAIVPEFGTEHHEWEGPHGETRYRDEVYRGKDKIMRVVKFQDETTKEWKLWRYYYIDGKAVLVECDNSEGKAEVVTLIKNNETYDQFKRQPDGSLKPLSSDDLPR